MNILVTMEKGEERNIYFPDRVIDELHKLGTIRMNNSEEPYTQEELIMHIRDMDICITHWGSPKFSREVLEQANNLKMIAHAAGTVSYLVSDEVYDRGIKVCSANFILARFVAEGVLAYILSGLRMIPQHDRTMKSREWQRDVLRSRTLFDQNIGFIGLGMVGRHLLELLEPFHVKVRIYDPYINEASLKNFSNAELCSLEDTLTWGNILSVHASLTPETVHMIGAPQLRMIKDGTLFVNTARGAIIDEKALEDELRKNRFFAVLDVFEKEPLDSASPLLNFENVILMPHMAGAAAKEQMTLGILEEIVRFLNNEPLLYEITKEKYKLMTRTDLKIRVEA